MAPAVWDKPLRDIYKNDKELEASNLPENVPVKCLNSTGCAGKLQLIKCCWHERVKWGSVLILWKPSAAYFRYFSALTPDSNEWFKVNHLTGVLEQLLHLQHAGQGLVSSQCHVLNLQSSSKELDSRTFLKSLSYLWSEIPASQATTDCKATFGAIIYTTKAWFIFFTDWQVCLYWHYCEQGWPWSHLLFDAVLPALVSKRQLVSIQSVTSAGEFGMRLMSCPSRPEQASSCLMAT